jgi:hypothetical protein
MPVPLPSRALPARTPPTWMGVRGKLLSKWAWEDRKRTSRVCNHSHLDAGRLSGGKSPDSHDHSVH